MYIANLSNQEKQEIKTVRIVKRESERRHRDREKGNVSVISNSSQNLDQVLEEEAQIMDRSRSLPRTYIETTHEAYKPYHADRQIFEQQSKPLPLPPQHITSVYSSNPSIPLKYTEYYNIMNHYPVSLADDSPTGTQLSTEQMNSTQSQHLYADQKQDRLRTSYANYLDTLSTNINSGLQQQQRTESIQSLTKTIGVSPMFQSEAAKQIIFEMSGNTSEENNDKNKLLSSNKQKRTVPKEKRRHYTAPNTLNAKSMQNIQTENDLNKNVSFKKRFKFK